MAIFTKKGKQFDTTGRCSTARSTTNNVFKGFGGTCEARNNGDAVVRYDQLADRWLIVMPIFGARSACGPISRRCGRPAEPAYVSPPGVAGQPGRRGAAVSSRRHRRPRHPIAGGRSAAAAASAAPAGPSRARTRCATRSAPAPIRSARTIATSSCGRSSPTTRVRRSGPTATTCRPAPATTSSRSTRASSIARRC